jgi:anti-anti-sigma factor
MECQVRRANDVAELVLAGSLDASWSPYLADRIDDVVRAGAVEVWFDMGGVTYLSSHGIAILVRYHQQLRKIGGRVRILACSELVASVLKLTGVAQLLAGDGPLSTPTTSAVAESNVIECDGMTLQMFPGKASSGLASLSLIGEPGRLPGHGYEAWDERILKAEPGIVALGLGALGPGFDECRGRFGEFLAVAGVAAYRPSAGDGRPDFEHAARAFVPSLRVLYGLAFPTATAAVMRFESSAEPGSPSVSLSRIARACLDQTAGRPVGIVIAGESDGLVGAAIRRSPVGLAAGTDPFAHPGVRDWLSFTPEPEFSRTMALVVGVATHQPIPALAPFVRPLLGGVALESSGVISGHFHAAVLPYRPIPAGAIELDATVNHLIEPGRIETILHLLGDARPILGAGESLFKRGAIWYVPLSIEGGAPSP